MPLRPPLKILTHADASHATKESAYAREGVMVLIMEDNKPTVSADGIVQASSFGKIDGFAHCLVCAAHKSKRVSYSTSHAETLSACFGKELAQVLSLRITEILGSKLLHLMCMRDRIPTVKELIKMQELNCVIMPTDHCTDCNDLFELVCSGKSLPQDRMQRVYVMSIREDRVLRKIRNMIKVPTEIMLGDGLTKVKKCEVLHDFIRIGCWVIPRKLSSNIIIKSSPLLTEIDDEKQLANLAD